MYISQFWIILPFFVVIITMGVVDVAAYLQGEPMTLVQYTIAILIIYFLLTRVVLTRVQKKDDDRYEDDDGVTYNSDGDRID